MSWLCKHVSVYQVTQRNAKIFTHCPGGLSLGFWKRTCQCSLAKYWSSSASFPQAPVSGGELVHSQKHEFLLALKEKEVVSMPPLGEIPPHVAQLGVNLAVCSTKERVAGKSQGFQWQRCACTFLACGRGTDGGT